MGSVSDFSSTRADPMDGGAFPPRLDGTPHDAGIRFPLLLALADDETAPAAIRLTASLARSKGAVPTVLHAVGDVRSGRAELAALAGQMPMESLDAEYVDTCRNAMRLRITEVAGPVEWQLDVNEQAPIDAILEEVRSLRAGLIVMGLRSHGVLRRMISRDLLAQVLRSARVPVLAVRTDIASLPKRVVVAIDFGAASIRAAHMARALLADDGAMSLVHVSLRSSADSVERLARLVDALAPSPAMTITSTVLHGDIQSAIERFAQATSADLLAMGSGNQGLLDRVTNGRIAMQLARTARWSTLIVPASRDD